jgi:tetratricopeptide (TPR) repeat protein
VSGADESLSYLHEGMVDLLSARFVDDSLAHAVDPGRTISAWRRLDDGEDEISRDNALQLADRVGATGVIVGSVVGEPSRVFVTATLLSSSGARDIEVRAEGPADSLTAVIDRLAARLLAAKYGEAERLDVRTTSSLPALRAYLTGQAFYRRGAYKAAARQYESALSADSQFALAALQLALAADRINDGEQNGRALAIAWLNRQRLNARDRAHLVAFAGRNYPFPSPTADALPAWGAALNLTPASADIWYEFGERLFHHGIPLAIADAPQRAVRAFERSLQLDVDDNGGARAMLVLAAARIGDSATVRQYASPAALRDSMGALSPFVAWTVARMFDDKDALAEMHKDLEKLDDVSLRMIAMAALYDRVHLQEGQRATAILRRRMANSRSPDLLLAEHAFAVSAGDKRRALELTERIGQRLPGLHAQWRLRVLDALYGDGSREAAEDAAARLTVFTTVAPRRTELERAVFLSDLCVIEQWRLAHSDRTRTGAAIDVLRSAEFLRVPVSVGTSPQSCAALLESWLAVDTGSPDARQHLMSADSMMFDGPSAGDAANYAHILLARLHSRVGDTDRALKAIRRRSYLTGWPRYISTALASEAALSGSPQR